MDRIFEESGYRFDFSTSIKANQANNRTIHDLPDVDFLVETEDNILFIEVKNPDDKKAKEESRKRVS